MQTSAEGGSTAKQQTSDLRRGLLIAGNLALAAALAALVLGLLYVISLALGRLSMDVPPRLQELDTALYRWINHLQDPNIARFVLAVANDPGLDYTLVIAPCLAFVWMRRRGETLFAAAALGATLAIGAWTSPLTSEFGFRQRPFVGISDAVVDDFWRQIWVVLPTFPSGHVRELTGMSIVLIYFWPKAALLAVPYVLAIGFSRVYLGAHYPLDVGAGIVLGVLSGAVSLVVVGRLRRMIALAREVSWVRTIYRRLFADRAAPSDAVALRLARAVTYLALLLGVAALAGYPIYTQEPIIIFAYMRNVDNSVLNPIFALFDPGLAAVAYWIVGNSYAVGAALSLIVLGRSLARGRSAALRAIIMLSACYAAVYLLTQVDALQHSRPRPIEKPELAVAEAWRLLWPGPSSYPDTHVVLVSALAAVLAATWPRIGPLAYAYLLPVALGMLYFGAVWPTQVVASLVVGYLCGRYAVVLSEQLMPQPGGLRAPQLAARP